MQPTSRGFWSQALACWNWKCALLSATARSLVYMAAMARGTSHGRLAIVLVEVAYVTLTAGLYAGLQQRALSIRNKLIGDLTIVLAVPSLAQTMDWLVHRATGAAAPAKATLAVCLFTLVSALFHLHVMRRGAFLTGRSGRTLTDDFRRIPSLAAGFALKPYSVPRAIAAHDENELDNEAAA
jgi:hypothetical protein